MLPIALTLLVVAATFGVAAPVTVGFDPSNTAVRSGSTFAINLVASIPEPVVGWGLDISFDQSVLSLNEIVIDPTWFPTTSPDGDDLSGLAFPFAVTGANVVLATLKFTALMQGMVMVFPNITPSDSTEGFALETGGFTDMVATPGNVTVVAVPEPATVICLVPAWAFMAMHRKARYRTRVIRMTRIIRFG
jgi:hypothetical protein